MTLADRTSLSSFAALVAGVSVCCLAAGWSQAQERMAYTTRFVGVEAGPLLESLEQLSDALNLEDEPPQSAAAIRRRATRDVGRFQKALQAAGHYGASVRAEVRTEETPAAVIYQITPGPVYPLGALEIVSVAEGLADASVPTPAAAGLIGGQPGTTAVILTAETRLLGLLRDSGHPFPAIVDRVVIADHNVQQVEVRFEVDPGPKAVFGEVDITGLETLDPVVVLDALPWQRGATYRQRLLRDAEMQLYLLNLFSVVQVGPGEAVDSAGEVPIKIAVTERKHRTIAGGVAYTTDYGAGVEMRWEHRNFRGRGQRLTLETHLNRLLRDLRGEYHVPHWRRQDQALTYNFEVGLEDTDAYRSDRAATRVWVERDLSERTRVAVGLGLRFSEVEQRRFTSQYRLLSVHGRLQWDSTDNLLDPSRGARIRLELAPYVDVWGGEARFLHTELSASTYWGLGGSAEEGTLERPDWVLALRARLGAIGANRLRDVPPDLRFYAGGGGSVRGYSYQSIGPHEAGKPLGGRSVIEAAMELRRRLNDRMGMAVFVDGGMVYSSTVPDFHGTPRFGAGAGLRYFTPLGPMRLDFAVPLNPPDHMDAPFQIYLSIGQAF